MVEYNKQNFKKDYSKCTFNEAQQSILKNPNVHHMGPTARGQRLNNFVLVLKDGDNPMSKINSSAQFSKMAVDLFYEEVEKKPNEKPG